MNNNRYRSAMQDEKYDEKRLDELCNMLKSYDYAQTAEQTAQKPGKSIRLSVLLAAAVAAVGLMLMAFSYGDEIMNAIFKRQTELVDNKSAVMVASATAGDISVSIDMISAQEGLLGNRFFADYYLTFRKNSGAFENGISFSGFKLDMLLTDGLTAVNRNQDGSVNAGEWYEMIDYQNGEMLWEATANNIVSSLDEMKRLSAVDTDCISFSFYSSISQYTDYRITFYNLTSADGSIVYADELTLEYTLTEDAITPVTQLNCYTPEENGFILENCEFNVKDIFMKPTQLNLAICNPAADRYELNGEQYLAINYLVAPRTSAFYSAVDESLAFAEEHGILDINEGFPVEYIEASNEYITKLNELNKVLSTDEELISSGYKLMVELNPECGATVINAYDILSFTSFHGVVDVQYCFAFSSPIYVDDIIRVYARKIGDPTKEVTIWVPAEDKTLQSAVK